MRILQTKDLYLEQSGYQLPLFLEKRFSKARANLLVWISGALVVLFAFFTALFAKNVAAAWKFLGGAEIFLSLFLCLLVYRLFLGYLEEDHSFTFEEVKKAWEHEAFGRILSFAAATVLEKAGGGEDLIVPALWDYAVSDSRFLWILWRLNIPPLTLKQIAKEQYPPAAALPLVEVLKTAWQKALGANRLRVEFADIFMAVFELDKIFQRILYDCGAQESDIREVLDWQRRRELSLKEKRKFWKPQNLLSVKGIGKDWSGGYTLNLDKVAVDITEAVKIHKPKERLYGHKDLLEILERMLVRAAGFGNVVLVGPPGVGRHTLIRAFGAKLNQGETLAPLRYLRLLLIDSAAVIGGVSSLNEVVERIEILFSEALMAGNVILAINDIDAFFDSNPEAGRVNATEALLPYLQSKLRIISLTTPAGYQTTIGKNPQLSRFIGKLEISEPTVSETLSILQDAVLAIEGQSRLFFTHAALKETTRLATKLIQNLPNPEKSLEILHETAVYVATETSESVVLPEHVQKVVSLRTKVPVEKVTGEEKDILLNLESILHERIVNQDEAVREIADALRRARAGVRSEKRPIGSFLFLGPTGVGKTETAKALAAVYFGSESRIIRFDMSEFQEIHSINRLIGDAGSSTSGMLTESIIANPFSLILLDELEKAHPKVLDLFLQVFDEGRLMDALGRAVDFTNSMIIVTSNAGAELIREMTMAGKNPAEAKAQILDYLQRQGIFLPEFLNRFDGVIVFRPLSPEQIEEVAELLLGELNRRLEPKGVEVVIKPKLLQKLAQLGYSPEFGARPLRRVIAEKVENLVAEKLLRGEIKRGDKIEINPQEI